jgi:hypothetical protein
VASEKKDPPPVRADGLVHARAEQEPLVEGREKGIRFGAELAVYVYQGRHGTQKSFIISEDPPQGKPEIVAWLWRDPSYVEAQGVPYLERSVVEKSPPGPR